MPSQHRSRCSFGPCLNLDRGSTRKRDSAWRARWPWLLLLLIIAGRDLTLHAEPPLPRLVATVTSDDWNLGRVEFTADGKTLAVAAGDILILWDVDTRRVRNKLKGPSVDWADYMTFAPDG